MRTGRSHRYQLRLRNDCLIDRRTASYCGMSYPSQICTVPSELAEASSLPSGLAHLQTGSGFCVSTKKLIRNLVLALPRRSLRERFCPLA
jgi:hypothetical protein